MKHLVSFRTLFLFCLLFVFLWFIGVRLPFVGIYNANNNYLLLGGRNFLQFGFRELSFLPTYFVGGSLPPFIPYYLHHPTGMFFLTAWMVQIFHGAPWSVHVVPFVFTLGSLVVLYALIRDVAGKRVAAWSAFFAASFPMVAVFWKYMMFEQASLFFTLLVFWCAHSLLKKPDTKTVWYLLLVSLGGALVDWYGAYALFAFTYLLWVRGKDMRVRNVFAAYAIGTVIGFGAYAWSLSVAGNWQAAWEGYRARSLTSELSVLAFWPVRLVLVTALRMVLYFTPLLIFLKKFPKEKSDTRRDNGLSIGELSAMFFIVGVVNLVVMPAATWGHSYFLYYAVPFVAFYLGQQVAVREAMLRQGVWGIIIVQLVCSVGISMLKAQQVAKQSWKYDMALAVEEFIPPYTKVAVLNFPGDVLEQYTHHPTVVFDTSRAEQWATGERNEEHIQYMLVTCVGTCTPNEYAFIKTLKQVKGVREFTYPGQIGWLVGGEPRERPRMFTRYERVMPGSASDTKEDASFPLRVYRRVRDVMGSTQL